MSLYMFGLLIMLLQVGCKEYDSQFLLKTGFDDYDILYHLTSIKAVPDTPDHFYVYEYFWLTPIVTDENEFVRFHLSLVIPS